MRATIVLPLGFGAVCGLAGAAFIACSGWSVLAVLLGYSLCGALGVLAGGFVNLLFSEAEATSAQVAPRLGEDVA
jgi:predicted permease